MTSVAPLRRLVRGALVDAAGAAPDRVQLASAFDVLCERLRARLYPLFGATAVEALFARAVHVSTSEFPWLRGVVLKDGLRCALEGLETATSDLALDVVREGLSVVLAHQIELLSTFVGDDLTAPIVQESWGIATWPKEQAGGDQ